MYVASVSYSARNAAAQFARSLTQTGFAVIEEPPFPHGELDRIRDEWLAFFATDAKHAYEHRAGDQAGYFPAPDGAAAAGRDVKEFFHVRPDGPYPSEVSAAAARYFERALDLGRELLGWIQGYTPLEVVDALPEPLPEMIEGSSRSVLRIQHYLPVDERTRRELRALAHSDINLLTLLPAPQEPGLQVRSRDGTWHDVPGASEALIVNAGEMLELLSRGRYRATPHRVVNPPAPLARRSRVSMPLFLHPRGEIVLDGRRTAAEYLAERVEELAARGWAVAPGGKPGGA